MRKNGHLRTSLTLEEIQRLSSSELDQMMAADMPDSIFRLVTFEKDDYEKGGVTLFFFNFVPPYFYVDFPRDRNPKTVLEEIGELNPGLDWEKVEIEQEFDETDLLRTIVLQIVSIPAREGINNTGERIYLTQLDIQAVYKTLRHPAFQMGAFGMFSGGNPLNPCFLSPRGMIFIYGNDHYGVTHINQRHGWFTDSSEWRIDESGRQFLDCPSKFSQSSIPVVDYTRIADEIYKSANSVPSKEEKIFEKYTGVSDYAGEKGMIFHLIVYKGTKIVHTLFPQSKKLNRIKKNILNYKKGKLTVDYKPFYNQVIAKIPYYNTEMVIRYVIIIKLDNNSGRRQIWIETTTLKGNPMYSVMVQETFGNPPMKGEQFFRGLEYADYRGMEKWIKNFDSSLEKNVSESPNIT